MALEKRQLGSTGHTVTALGFGSMELRGIPHRRPRPIPVDVARSTLEAVLDVGITFIDTSIDYGSSEEIIGRYLGSRRDEYVLASKAGCPIEHQPDGPTEGSLAHDYSPANIRAGVEQSLRRLGTDRLDLVQLHISPSLETIRANDALGTLETLRDEGKLTSIGISSTLPHLADHLGSGLFESFQLPYSALDRRHESYLPQIAEAGAGLIVRGGVAQGITDDELWRRAGLDDLLDGDSPQEFLLRFVISNPAVSTVIVGTASPDHVRSNARAAERGPLPADIVRESIDRLNKQGQPV